MHQVTALITTDVADIILKLTSAAFFWQLYIIICELAQSIYMHKLCTIKTTLLKNRMIYTYNQLITKGS
jgi:hypothetical protein